MFNGDRGAASDLGVCVGADRGQGTMIASTTRGAGARLQQMTGRVGRGVVRFGQALAKRMLRAHVRRVSLRELEALDDRTLKDIGLARGSIPYHIERTLTRIDAGGTALVRSTQGPHPKAASSRAKRAGALPAEYGQ
jgi:uncharacterized protein YjiS (DUF1127 family)